MAISTTFTLKFAGAAVERGLSRVKSAFKSLGGVAMKVGKSLISPFAKLAAMLAPVALAAGMTALLKGASETASRFEQMELKFRMFTGSLESARQVMEGLRAIDIVSNLDIETLGQGASLLMAYGMSAKDALENVEKLSKISGGNSDAFGSLALAFGQTMASMKLKGDDLRQYTERGWNPLEQIMARTGETFEEVRKRMEASKVTFYEVKQALNEVTSGSGRFAKAHELGSKTFMSATSRMKTQWMLLQNEFGKPFNIALGEIFDRITRKIPELSAAAKEWGNSVGKTMIQLVDAFEQGRLGEVLEAALMAGTTRAGEEMIAAMVFAGNTLYDTIAGRMEGSDLGKLMNIGDPLSKGKVPGLLKFTGPGAVVDLFQRGKAVMQHFADRGGSTETYQQTREGFRDAFGSGGYAAALNRTMQKQGQVPNVPGWRYARPDEYAATIMDGERVVRILTNIERNLAPQP